MMKRGPKIFVMDDEKAFLEELDEMLSLSGYEVRTCSDNEHAIERIREFNPHLLLLDLKMTPRSGFQIAHDMKNNLHWHNLIIIAMSGYFLEKEHLTLMQECGIKSFLAKPFKPLNLIATIEFEINQLKGKSLQRENRVIPAAHMGVPHVEEWKIANT